MPAPTPQRDFVEGIESLLKAAKSRDRFNDIFSKENSQLLFQFMDTERNDEYPYDLFLSYLLSMDSREDETMVEIHEKLQSALAKEKLKKKDVTKAFYKYDKKERGVIKIDGFESVISDQITSKLRSKEMKNLIAYFSIYDNIYFRSGKELLGDCLETLKIL